MNIVLPQLTDYQKDLYNAVMEDNGRGRTYVVKAKRQCGKSAIACVLLIAISLSEKTTNIIVEPTLNQSRRVFKQITSMMQGSNAIKNANQSLLSIEFTNGSEIMLKSAEQQESLRGMTATGIMVIDEGAFIKDDIYEILFPCVDAHRTPLMIISTPLFEDGYFFKFYNDNTNNIVYDWCDYDTSMFLPQEKLEYYRTTMSTLKFQSEYLGQFIRDGSYVFGNIYDCIAPKSDNPPVYAGIDWGSGNGGDYTVMTLLDDNKTITTITAFNNVEPVEQIAKLSAVINQNPTLKAVAVETNSIGNVYISMLKQSLRKPHIIKNFTTTNESKRKIIEQLVAAFPNKKINIIDDKELIKELNHYTVMKTSKGYTYNGLSGYNDDYVMSLAFAYDAAISKSNYNLRFN